MDIQVLASGSKGNCYRVEHAGSTLLLEAGLPFAAIRRALDFQVSALDGCLISHEHLDHAQAAGDLMRAGVEVYCSRGTADALGLRGHRLHFVHAHRVFHAGGWAVYPLDTVHDAKEPLAYVLACGWVQLLFATDTAYLRYQVPGCTHMMIECNYDLRTLKANVETGLVPREVKRRVMRSHMELGTLIEFLRANDLSRVREIWLLHLSNDSSDERAFADAIKSITGVPVYVAGGAI